MKKMRSILVTVTVLFFYTMNAQPVLELPVYKSGFSRPVDIANAGDGRLFIVEKEGKIKIIKENGDVPSTPFLDISDRSNSRASEQGLLGLAFHPAYAENGYFFVNYSNPDGDTHISRFRVSDDNPDRADPESEKILLVVDQPYANHNAGDLAFGPDGYLYFGLGDGGSGSDPQGNGQNPRTFLGKMLRIDVDRGDPYAIPPDNPFAETDEVLDEIWALGLRNPWRFSFDRLTGDMWIGDVGQGKIEEIDLQPASSRGGENYGWRCWQGDEKYFNQEGCPSDDSGFILPVHTYQHDNTNCWSVTGGFVYRGSEFPGLQGYYIYGDYCTGDIWGLYSETEGEYINKALLKVGEGEISTFGEDSNGELFMAGYSSGNIFRVTDACASVIPPEITISEDVLLVPDNYISYQWFIDGKAAEGANSSEFIPTASGAVTVEVMEERGCTVMSDPFIVTAVPQAIGIRWWQATPNPFRGQLRLEIELTEPAVFLVKIYDTSGRLVFKDRLDRAMRWNLQYQLDELKSGLYFLSLERGKQQVIQKILKTD